MIHAILALASYKYKMYISAVINVFCVGAQVSFKTNISQNTIKSRASEITLAIALAAMFIESAAYQLGEESSDNKEEEQKKSK